MMAVAIGLSFFVFIKLICIRPNVGVTGSYQVEWIFVGCEYLP